MDHSIRVGIEFWVANSLCRLTNLVWVPSKPLYANYRARSICHSLRPLFQVSLSAGINF